MDPFDAHVAEATRVFRASGFDIGAMQYKRSSKALAALLDFNGAPVGWKHPFAWAYFPNPAMRDFWARRLGSAE